MKKKPENRSEILKAVALIVVCLLSALLPRRPHDGGPMRVSADEPGAFLSLVRILDAGGIAIAPGDTMYGMIGVARSRKHGSVGSREGERTSHLSYSLREASWSSRFSDRPVPPRLARYWPGPLTMIFRRQIRWHHGHARTGFAFLRDLGQGARQAAVLDECQPAGSAAHANGAGDGSRVRKDVDIIYDAGDQPPGAPSTLVDITARPYQRLFEQRARSPFNS